MVNRIIDAYPIANKLLRDCLALKKSEELLVVIDTETDMTMAQALGGVATDIGSNFTIAMMLSRNETNAHQIPETINRAMDGADVYIGMTRASGAGSYSTHLAELVHNKKLRECSMVMRSLDNFTKGGALADYKALYAEGLTLKTFWEQRKTIQITTPAGTGITAQIGANPVYIECGIARNPGDTMAFSDGEVSQGPNPKTVNGHVVVDGPICQLGMSNKPLVLEVADSKIIKIIDGDTTKVNRLERILESVPGADNFAEIGLGLNPESQLNGDFEEEKKARGTCHIALGDDIFFGGATTCAIHWDMVMYNVTARMDSTEVVSNGIIKTDAFSATK